MIGPAIACGVATLALMWSLITAIGGEGKGEYVLYATIYAVVGAVAVGCAVAWL